MTVCIFTRRLSGQHFAMFGAKRMILISDSMRATGLEDGEYTLGGQAVTVRGPLATLHDGTIGRLSNQSDGLYAFHSKAGRYSA